MCKCKCKCQYEEVSKELARTSFLHLYTEFKKDKSYGRILLREENYYLDETMCELFYPQYGDSWRNKLPKEAIPTIIVEEFIRLVKILRQNLADDVLLKGI